MSRKQIIGGIVLIIAAAGVIVFMKSRGEASSSDEGGNTPTVVTVQTGELKNATLHRYVEGYGVVEPAPAMAGEAAADAPLAAPTAGIATRVNVVVGQRVNQGDVLVELNSGTTTYAFAEQEASRQERLYAHQNTSLKSLQDAESQMALLRITAPLSGTVVRVNVEPGQSVDTSTVVAEVMDLDRLVVRADLPAAATGLKVDDEVQVMTDPPVTTALAYVSPAVNKENDTVSVTAALPAGGSLRPGQSVPVRVVTEVHTNCLVAPAESVVTDENGRSAVAVIKVDTAVQTRVQTGLRETNLVEIAAPGLKAGDAVVTVGAYGLPEQTKVQVENAANGGTQPTDAPDAQ